MLRYAIMCKSRLWVRKKKMQLYIFQKTMLSVKIIRVTNTTEERQKFHAFESNHTKTSQVFYLFTYLKWFLLSKIYCSNVSGFLPNRISKPSVTLGSTELIVAREVLRAKAI